MSRTTKFGSPFKNLDSGRNESGDKENNSRIRTALKNYLNSEQGKEDAVNFEQTVVSLKRVQSTMIFAPLSGALVGKFAADTICAPGSIYLRKFLVLGFAYWGYRYYKDVKSSYKTSFLLKNFSHFPQEIQQTLRSHDSRYARKWLDL